MTRRPGTTATAPPEPSASLNSLPRQEPDDPSWLPAETVAAIRSMPPIDTPALAELADQFDALTTGRQRRLRGELA